MKAKPDIIPLVSLVTVAGSTATWFMYHCLVSNPDLAVTKHKYNWQYQIEKTGKSSDSVQNI